MMPSYNVLFLFWLSLAFVKTLTLCELVTKLAVLPISSGHIKISTILVKEKRNIASGDLKDGGV
jgi:hypothetical protein